MTATVSESVLATYTKCSPACGSSNDATVSFSGGSVAGPPGTFTIPLEPPKLDPPGPKLEVPPEPKMLPFALGGSVAAESIELHPAANRAAPTHRACVNRPWLM